MLNHIRGATTKITDLLPGSVSRTLVEAPAVEIEELYLQIFNGLREAIPVATFKSFGFDKLPAAVAAGYVSVASAAPLEADFPIPAGTEFTATDGRSYLSTEAVTWPAGTSIVVIPVAHTVPGLVGNIAAGAITNSPLFGVGFTVSNQAIINGRNVETNTEREARFAEFVASLSRGTVSACTYAARSASVLAEDGSISEYVTRLGLIEDPGFVRIYLYSSRGAPSAALLTKAQCIIDGWRDVSTGAITPGYRAGGVRVDVMPMIGRPVPLSVRVEMLPGYSLTPSVEQQLGDTYATVIAVAQPGEVLYVGTILDALLAVPGIKKIVPDTTENIVCGPYETLVAGALTVIAI